MIFTVQEHHEQLHKRDINGLDQSNKNLVAEDEERGNERQLSIVLPKNKRK